MDKDKCPGCGALELQLHRAGCEYIGWGAGCLCSSEHHGHKKRCSAPQVPGSIYCLACMGAHRGEKKMVMYVDQAEVELHEAFDFAADAQRRLNTARADVGTAVGAYRQAVRLHMVKMLLGKFHGEQSPPTSMDKEQQGCWSEGFAWARDILEKEEKRLVES